MRKEKFPILLLIAFGLILLINVLQGIFTELDPDEAYYWMYSRDLAWGYFDHPPFVALLIRTGSSLLPGSIGVRLWAPLLQLFSLWMIWRMLGSPRESKHLLAFILLALAFPMFQAYGFVMTPDVPLLFFTVLFFWTYQRFLKKPNILHALFWGASMALLLYSKYHGILIIGMSVLANLQLLRQKNFYLASIFGILLFLPHFYWQYAETFPSFQYHLAGRNDAYSIDHQLNFFLGQVYTFGPFLLPLLLIYYRKFKRNTAFYRFLFFLIPAVFVFFFLNSFNGHPEPQWTVVLCIPFIFLGYELSSRNETFRKFLYIGGGLSLFLCLLLRIAMLPGLSKIRPAMQELSWMVDLKEKSGGVPLFFQNSYRSSSKYHFYFNIPAFTYTDHSYRRNQYDLWTHEKELHNQEVLFVGECEDCKEIQLAGGKKIHALKVDSLQIAQKLELSLMDAEIDMESQSEKEIRLKLYNPYEHDIIPGKSELPLEFRYMIFGEKEILFDGNLEFALFPQKIPAQRSLVKKVKIKIDEELKGPFSIAFGFAYKGSRTSVLSPLYPIKK
ncbi:MAG: glycosyltransferase family 39 protein [Bacteroidia bacterium]|nr:glycosyltransferase family 39 protein [Bacteroidia bacterium]